MREIEFKREHIHAGVSFQHGDVKAFTEDEAQAIVAAGSADFTTRPKRPHRPDPLEKANEK